MQLAEDMGMKVERRPVPEEEELIHGIRARTALQLRAYHFIFFTFIYFTFLYVIFSGRIVILPGIILIFPGRMKRRVHFNKGFRFIRFQKPETLYYHRCLFGAFLNRQLIPFLYSG